MEKTFKILCPTDFSECSLNAIEYAARLGEKFNAILVLFHVLNREDYQKLSPMDTDGKYQLEFIQEKLKNLQKAVMEESLMNGLKGCEIAIREGKIVNGALDFAKEINADLIVAGTEGMNELRTNIIGSRASRMVEQSDRDIIIVPRKVFFKKPRKFVYASDYLEEDKLAIQKVVEMASFFDSEIDLVHISSSQKAIDKSLHMTMVDEIRPFVRYEKINYVLKAYRDDLGLGLENYLQVAKGDMLVTLSKKKSFFDQIFTKNLSKKMSYFLNKPLWVIKSF
ncbi:MAG: universal stress protein [Algoriphagus sp.]|jgi:nucleotide-binding universal stress UspA family protein|uniref:universal stress protein n=1 Tax=Algoriphagus sp. TaxID=1872435 RepID=UPI002727ADAA|nr:universal stress protein [Algoriphagus sp.]MDO8968138.1 universal stress protein [Algoriphagus sp.]MDP2042229.1 universal stress protein [Algoriphagus sp.]MDP3202239.1 universal stress protein [Algoriphagus sp.]MDP3471290.1 universal stress protein [Algoriphagus sp.]